MRHTGEPRVFNIGSGTGHSLNELIGDIENVLQREVSRRHLPGRPFDVPANVLDIGLAREALAWQPTTTLRDGLARSMEWMRLHPALGRSAV
jgi:UDP-glucose 4-epimerase